MILDDLPFDVILGNRTCKKWKSALTWETDMFEAQPNENDVRRVSVDWELYHGQHWRQSVTLIADETVVIPAESQKILAIKHFANQWEGIEPKTGLITPIRTKDVLSQKLAMAYMYGEDMQKVVLMNKTSTPLVIKKGTNIAELHPRTREEMCIAEKQ